MYLMTQEMCEAAGLPGYEVSNHAQPGQESRHNLIYWRMGDYAGIGPGAHGRLTLNQRRWATEAPKQPGAWLQMVEAGAAGESPRTASSRVDHTMEYLLMSLRLAEGSDMARFKAISGYDLPEAKICNLETAGLVRRDAGQLKTTAEGRLLLNAILRDLLV
jgi:oxygen-independent coproporphyrinogen-3 oxidase